MYGYNHTERWQILSGWVLLGQFKPLPMPVAPVFVITTPQQNQQNRMVIYTFDILSQHLTSKPSSSSSLAGAAQALLSLPVGWGSPGEQQHAQPGEAWWQNSAARSEGYQHEPIPSPTCTREGSGSSGQHEQPDVRGPGAAGWKTSCPCRVHSFSCVWAVSGTGRLRAWQGLQQVPQCQRCWAKRGHGPWDTPCLCRVQAHTCTCHTLSTQNCADIDCSAATAICIYLDLPTVFG